MLGKLLKYDLKFVYKVVGIFYVLAVIFSVIGRGLSLIENSMVFNVLSQISNGIVISMVVSSLINCLMRLWARMVLNVYKDESYLTHTLPVEKKTIYLSKVISTAISMFTTTLVAVLCLYICYYSKTNIEVLKEVLELAATTYNTTVINLLLVIFALVFVQIVCITLIGFLGIILGHKSNKNKMIKSIAIAFGIYMLVQFLMLGVIYCYGLFNPQFMNLIITNSNIEISTLKTLMYVAMLLYIIVVIGIYTISKKQLEKGVNVE